MGVAGLWEILQPASRHISLAKLCLEAIEENKGGHRAFRVGIDASLWIFHSRAVSGGENPKLRTLFFKVVHLLKRPLLPVFVFDGPHKPAFKRGSRVGGSWGTHDRENTQFKQLLDVMGLARWDAPGEAEAELAQMNRQGLIDAVLSDDVDALLFGATCVLRNPSEKLSQNVGSSSAPGTKNHIYQVYRSDAIQRHFQSLGGDLESAVDCTDGMILIAMLSGGDYLPAGVKDCGPTFAQALAQAGYHKILASYRANPSYDSKSDVADMADELETNSRGFLKSRRKALAASLRLADFPDKKVVQSYLQPTVSPPGKGWPGFAKGNAVAGRGTLEGLALACEKYFEWGTRDIVVRRFRTCGAWEIEALTRLRAKVLERDGVLATTTCTSPTKDSYTLASPSPPMSSPSTATTRIRTDITAYFKQSIAPRIPAKQPKPTAFEISRISSSRRHANTDMSQEYRIEFSPVDFVRAVRSAMRGIRKDPAALSHQEREALGLKRVEIEDEDGEGEVEDGKSEDPEAPLKIWALDRLVQLAAPDAIAAYDKFIHDKELRKSPRKKKNAIPTPTKAKPKSGPQASQKQKNMMTSWLSQRTPSPSSDDEIEILDAAPPTFAKAAAAIRPPPSISSAGSADEHGTRSRRQASPTKARRLGARHTPSSLSERSASEVIDLSMDSDSEGGAATDDRTARSHVTPSTSSVHASSSRPAPVLSASPVNAPSPDVDLTPRPKPKVPQARRGGSPHSSYTSPKAHYTIISCDSDEEVIDCT